MSTTPRILATSGGFRPTARYGVMEPAGLMVEALRLTGKDRPKVAFVLTASGDDRSYLSRTYGAFRGWSVDLTHLELFTMPNADPRELLLGQDLVWVGGGSVANLLAVWRVHGLDTVLREAWESGVLLGGVSAGSICWHVGGPTDSFGPDLATVTNGLALLPYGNGVHYDSEEQRRPLLHRLVADAVLPTSYATDDGTGILYEGTEPVRVIADDPPHEPAEASRETGRAAYRIERTADGTATETRLPVGPIRS
jgi:peptidase E